MAVSTTPLKQLFSKHFDFTPSLKLAKDIIKWRTLYENRDTHSDALNTPLLGVFRLKFLPSDAEALFGILSINRVEFANIIKQSSVNTDFMVASDPYNLLVTWACHKFYNSNIPRNIREEACISMFFMLLVKFFSGFVGHMLPHGANQEIMEATIDSLSDKYDIRHKETCTWKLVMLARAKELISQTNIHFNALKNYTPDQKVTYLLTDTQTRLRTKLKWIIQEYHKMKEKGKTIAITNLTDDDANGDKIVREIKNNYDTMITSVTNKCLNINQFIKTDYIKIACAKSANVEPDKLRQLLVKFSALATLQYQKHKQEEIDKLGNYRGYQILIRNLIQRTYRACVVDKVNLKSKLAILEKACNLYRSSRINDTEILKIKASVDAMVTDADISRREATNASLKISFIVYIMLMTFDTD